MADPSGVPVIVLRKGCDRRLIQGHDWIFSNEIEPAAPGAPPGIPGQLVHVHNRRGKFLAAAYYHPHTLIAARVVSRRPLVALDEAWLGERLHRALAMREQIFSKPFYRWVHGEGDYLPGLIIDRFGEYLSLQVTTAGMERLQPALERVLLGLPWLRGAIVRLDESAVRLEGQPPRPPTILGELPPRVTVVEDALEFVADLREGQKTGWFYDQRSNRRQMVKYVRGGPVLDAFCYSGAWGIAAARAGAAGVVCADASAEALRLVEANAARNGVAVERLQGDAFDLLRALQGSDPFQLIVLDPPALIKRKKDFEAGLQAYYQLNRLAAKLLQPDGFLVSCSCSYHLPFETLVDIVHHAARSVGRRAVLTEAGQQSPDHPVQPAIPETRYLKAVFCQFRECGEGIESG